MSKFDGLGKHLNNPACTKSVRVFKMLKLDTTQKKDLFQGEGGGGGGGGRRKKWNDTIAHKDLWKQRLFIKLLSTYGTYGHLRIKQKKRTTT